MKSKCIPLFTLMLLALPIIKANAGIATYNRWKISEINVCFAEKETEYSISSMEGAKRDWKPREKKTLQKVLEEEYTVAKTGYTFVGFQDCKDTKDMDVVVGVRKGLSLASLAGLQGVATVGPMSRGITSYRNARGAVVLSPMGVARNTIAHEFGHILSLQHEQDHPNALVDAVSICPYYSGNTKFYDRMIYTDFDKKSVMNYCYMLSPEGWHAGLSVKDQELILDIYNQKYPYVSGVPYRP